MPNFDLGTIITAVQNSTQHFLAAWSVVRICPHQIETPPEGISFNPLTLAVSVVIFAIARGTAAISSPGIAIDFLANVISTGLMFLTGFVVIILAPGADAADRSKKWGTFFVMTWLVSLMLIILDTIPFWLGRDAFTVSIMSSILGPDSEMQTWSYDLIRAAFTSVIAVIVMLFKSWRMDKKFTIRSWCALLTCIFGLAINVLLIEGFIFGHFTSQV